MGCTKRCETMKTFLICFTVFIALMLACSSVAAEKSTVPADTTPPVRSGGLPKTDLAEGVVSTTISLNTNEAATCRYSLAPGIPYRSMKNTFSKTGGTTHSQLITNLRDGVAYAYYVKCIDKAGNANRDDYGVGFNVLGIEIPEKESRDILKTIFEAIQNSFKRTGQVISDFLF